MKASPAPEPEADGSAAIDPVTGPQTNAALAALLRWEAAGGTWVMRAGKSRSTVVDLTTCDGGDVMGQLVSSSPEFVAYVRAGVKEGPDPDGSEIVAPKSAASLESRPNGIQIGWPASLRLSTTPRPSPHQRHAGLPDLRPRATPIVTRDRRLPSVQAQNQSPEV